MANILITGGTGNLGKSLSKLLTELDIAHFISSRNNRDNKPNWVKLDLLQNQEIKQVLNGKDIVIHLATDFKKDLEVTQNLLNAIENKSKVHFIYISIVGVDKVPFAYYKQKLINGRYSLRANLDSTGSMTTLSDNLKGEFTVDSPGGRIYKLTLLSRILSVINIAPLFKGKLPDLEQNGFSYNNLTVNAQVNQGRIVFKDSVIDGQDMTIIFNGWMDPKLGTLELIFLVAPFKTADILIEKIPILGTILQGRLVSIPVKATGSVNNPNVFLLPPAEVGKGLMGTMQRILEAPFKLIEKLPGNGS